MNRFLLPGAAVLAAATSIAFSLQPSGSGPLAPPANGPRRADPTWNVLADCTLHARPGETIEHATVVIKDGRISAILPPEPTGAGDGGEMRPARTPIGPRVFDCKGLHIYAGFIDPYVEVAAPPPAPDSPGLHWNANVTPQRSALDGAGLDERTAESLRKLGFTAAAISPQGGIFRGRSAVVSLAKIPEERSADRPPVYRPDVYQSVAFRAESRGYPGSQMGAIALIRQTLSDADWQSAARASGTFTEAENCLDILVTSPRHAAAPAGEPRAVSGAADPGMLRADEPQDAAVSPALHLFDTDNELEALRAAKIATEFNRDAAILGSGTEFRRLAAIQKDNLPYILPLSFPRTPDVSSITRAEATELREFMTWEQGPTNPRRVINAGVNVSFTTAKLRDRADFTRNLRTAIKHGLTETQALAALTTTPAELLGVADDLGTVETGKRANLIVADGPVFAEKTKLRAVWIDGRLHEIVTLPTKLEGTWTVEIPGAAAAERALIIDKDNNITLKRNDKSVKCTKVAVEGGRVSFAFDHEPLDDQKGVYMMTGAVERDEAGEPARLIGTGVRASGERFAWSAARKPPSAALGIWKVIEADGQIKDENAADGLTIRITGDAVTLTFTKPKKEAPKPAEGAKPEEARQPEPNAEPKPDAPKADAPPPGEDQPRRGRRGGGGRGGRSGAGGDDEEATVIRCDDVKIEANTVTFTHDLSKLGSEGKSSDVITVSGDTFVGESTLPDGSKHTYKAKRQCEEADEAKKREEELARIKESPENYGTPFGPYAMSELPKQETLVLTNATIWTNTGKPIQNGTMVVSGGKIVSVSAKGATVAQPEGATVIDCAGKHITAGVIDCHSHTGISGGVNEGGQAVTAEVRIADVTNPDDVNWYRQLAGGVTAVNNLHGSANAIGGQSQTNKIRWGVAHPDDMHFEGAKPGIKFALGENPRQVNSQGRRDGTTPLRYPQTRMGVETLIRDRFTAAKEYQAALGRGALVDPSDRLIEAKLEFLRYSEKSHEMAKEETKITTELDGLYRKSLPSEEARNANIGEIRRLENRLKELESERERLSARSRSLLREYNEEELNKRVTAPAVAQASAGSFRSQSSAAPALRRDLELEALAEILRGDRLIHCHSYRQDEIVMLTQVARDFGFKIGTFQHILEGYKVADYVRDYSGGGSCFTDWWAYKVEVQDAIPDAGAIMHEVGVVVSFNSDSNELARRLNVEAAKAVKYGNVAEEEALKFVTLNPAKQLQVDSRVGTLETGKDADFVIWSGPPMSTLVKAEATYVDGRCYFSLEQDAKHRETIAKERTRLIQKALAEGSERPGGGGGGGGRFGGRGQRPGGPPGAPGTPPSEEDLALHRWYMEMLQSGRDPMDAPGVCGCGLLH